MNGNNKKKYFWGFLFFTVLIPILFFADVLMGTVHIPFEETLGILLGNENSTNSHQIIILKSRLPKAITAMLCGSALSLSGLQMQTLFRNPLAGPYILGISSGAGLGVALCVMTGSIFGISTISSMSISIAAMLGSAAVLLVIFLFSLKIKDIMTVLIVGIMLGSVITAVIGILQYTSSETALKTFLLWSLGSLEGLDAFQINLLLLFNILGILILCTQLKNLNLLLLGESYAQSLGMKINKTRVWIIVSTSILAGSVTAFCGPIGFIGIIVPHLCRMFFQTSNHLILAPACILLGISILLLSDILSHLPGLDMVLPINSVTSIIGIPIILWIIIKGRSISKAF